MNEQPEFETHYLYANIYLMRRHDQWYPMKGTPQGNLAFLNGPEDNHDGTYESALIIAHKKGLTK